MEAGRSVRYAGDALIKHLHVKNYRILADVEVDLRPLTVLVGPNGCGKTTLLDAIQFFASLTFVAREEDRRTDGRLGARIEQFGPVGRRFLDGSYAVPIQLEGTIGHAGHEQTLTVQILETRPNPGAVLSLQDGESRITVELPSENPSVAGEFFSHLAAPTFAIRLNLDAAKIAAPSYSLDDFPVLQADGSGLASVLAFLASTDRGKLAAIEADLQQIVPQALRIRTPPARIEVEEVEQVRVDDSVLPRRVRRQHAGHRIEIEMAGVGAIIAPHLSVGTLTSLAMLTALHWVDGPRLLLLDDVEQGLHPLAQARLVRRIRKLQETDPDLQVVCTSHSPYVLDDVEPEDVRVLDVDDESRVRLAPLTSAPEFQRWTAFHAGELWSALGEGWVRKAAAEE